MDGDHGARPRSLARPEPGFWGRVFQRGDPFVWMTGAALGLSILMIVGILALITWRGFSAMWPENLVELRLTDGSVVLGEVRGRERMPDQRDDQEETRVLLRVSNRDLYGADFRWIKMAEVEATTRPVNAWTISRQEWGPFVGYLSELRLADRVLTGEEARLSLPAAIRDGQERQKAIRQVEKNRIGAVNRALDEKRLETRRLQLRDGAEGGEGTGRQERIEAEIATLQRGYAALEEELRVLRTEDARHQVRLLSVDGRPKELAVSQIVRAYQPNRLGLAGRLLVFGSRIGEFIMADPRESNTEGGVFPAIFGTVLMTLIMTVAVVPFGVLAALYLREYAKQGALVSAVRIAVNNLAGVPSIVFGVFGLGFFVYTIGGTIDQVFYPERLPNPTYGTGGILWASLTLALLTVPVVIVATEEALAAVPMGMREGSIACGASKFQTIWRIVLPSAAPGVMTGAILAMARGAGEVAPLMITGVVKLAPTLPLDGEFPFLHLDRRFMHLGFHIYDVGFQSPNVEAAKPMVYATALLLIVVVVLLNLTAIVVRNRLRRKYRGAHD